MKRYRKLTAGLLGVVMALSVCSFTAFADDTEKYAEGAKIEISSSDELVEAIKNQKNGQTWILEAGEYDLEDELISESFTINGEQGFVFPITADNLTIKAEDGADVTITSSYNPGEEQGGVWHNQNFITISGERVTIEGIDIKGNPNDYYDGTCNKAIELVDGAKNFTLKDVEILPTEDSDGKLWSGSIYFNVTEAGNCELENVTLYAWIYARTVTNGEVVAKDVTIDFRNNSYAGYSYEGAYSWNPGISGDKVDIEGFTIKVDNNTNIEKQVFNDNLKDGTTIELEEGTYETNASIVIDKNVTIVGNGSTISVVSKLDGEGSTNGSKGAIEINSGADVKIEDLTVEGNENVKHVINVYSDKTNGITNVELDNVTLKDGNGYGIVNNASNVTLTDVETSGNAWGGVNVDNADGASTAGAKLVINKGTVINEDNSVSLENKTGNSIETEINGGTFKGYVGYGRNEDSFGANVVPEDCVDVTIKNGTFATDISDFIDRDSEFIKDKDGNYVVMDEEKYEDYLDDLRDSKRHSYSLEEGIPDKDEEEEEPIVTPEPEEEGPFSDVGRDNPNYDAILEVYEKGWMVGISDGVFAPNGTLTRGMAVTILWNKAGQPEPVNVAPFLDVTGDAYYAKAVAWAYEQGIVSGYDATTFGPDDYVTTEQFTIMNDISNGRTPAAYVGGAPNATRGWVASMIVLD